MTSTPEAVASLNEQRMKAWEAAKSILDRAADEKRALSAEEREAYDRADREISDIDATRERMLNDAKRDEERQALNAEYERFAAPRAPEPQKQARTAVEEFFTRGSSRDHLDVDLSEAARHYEAIRAGARGQEFRAVLGDTGASGGSLTVPTDVARDIYSFLTASTAMRRTRATVIRTDSGNPVNFPKTSTHGIATQIANQDTALAGTDPVLAQMQLSAYDYGQLVAIGHDLLEDSGSDIIGYVTSQLGRALGEITATAYVVGTGSGEPNGVMTAIGGAGTIATGGSLVDPTFEKLIDVVYSVNDNYRSRGAEWLMRDLTASVIRKIRDGAGGTTGAFIWQPSPTVGLAGGQPDLLLGFPVHTDPNVASLASNAKVIAFGDFSAYYIRDVRNVRLERSDDYLFNKDQVAFRAKLRTDGDVIDTTAINILKRSV